MENKLTYYYDVSKKEIWVVGEDVWPSRAHIYDVEGNFISYDDSYDKCKTWCIELENCSCISEAINAVKRINLTN